MAVITGTIWNGIEICSSSEIWDSYESFWHFFHFYLSTPSYGLSIQNVGVCGLNKEKIFNEKLFSTFYIQYLIMTKQYAYV